MGVFSSTVRRASTDSAKTLRKFTVAAFSLITALAWNAAIQNSLKDLSASSGPYVYAVVVTTIALLVLGAIGIVERRVLTKQKQQEQAKANAPTLEAIGRRMRS